MRITGQDEKGRLIIDGEGEEVKVTKSIPNDCPCFVTNFVFLFENMDKHDVTDPLEKVVSLEMNEDLKEQMRELREENARLKEEKCDRCRLFERLQAEIRGDKPVEAEAEKEAVGVKESEVNL